jgi:hypothetical protein
MTNSRKFQCKLFCLISITSTMGCRTLEPSAVTVEILDVLPKKCENLGVVNVDWTWWGTSTETLNTMRNQTAKLGGNALLLQGDAIGLAYKCSAGVVN